MNFSFPVPLGSIPELSAASCKEIKASEGGEAVSGKYWFDLNKNGKPVFVYCDMDTEGNFLKYVLWCVLFLRPLILAFSVEATQ